MKKTVLVLLGLIIIYSNVFSDGGWVVSAVSKKMNNGIPFQYAMNTEVKWSDNAWFLASPRVTSISATSGSTAGGTSVTITGVNLTAAKAVTFGSANATSYTAI